MLDFRFGHIKCGPLFYFFKLVGKGFFVKTVNLFSLLFVFFFIIVPVFGAPEGNVSIESKEIEVQKKFFLRVEIYWEGGGNRYEIHPPRLKLPEGIKEQGVSSSALGGEKGFKIVYLCQLVGEKEGEYKIDPIEVDYKEKGKQEVFTKRIPGVSFKVFKKPIFGTKNQWIILGAGFVIFLGFFGGIYFWQSRKMNKKNILGPSREERRNKVLTMLEECRKFKTQGEWGKFFQTAILLHKEIASVQKKESQERELTEMEDLRERIKYGGLKPGAEVGEKHFRKLEKLVKNL